MTGPRDPERIAPPDAAGGEGAPRKDAWVSLTGAGFEFLAAVVLFFLLGSWLDATWGTSPWLTVAGAAAGITVATYLLIRHALRSERDAEPRKPGTPPRD